MPNAADLLLVAVLAVCAATDLRRGLIYNWISLPAAAAGVALGAWQGGWLGLGTALLGLFLGAGLFLAPFLWGAVGGGDVKLMAAVGSLAGPTFALKTALYGCLVGGAWALVVMLAKGRLQDGLANLGRALRGLAVPGLRAEPPRSLGLPGIPLAACLAGGALWTRFFDIWPGRG